MWPEEVKGARGQGWGVGGIWRAGCADPVGSKETSLEFAAAWNRAGWGVVGWWE